jgi:hypothetical protein
VPVVMHSLHDVHEVNAYRAVHVCLSICIIQLENRWTDLDEIWLDIMPLGTSVKSYFTVSYNW